MQPVIMRVHFKGVEFSEVEFLQRARTRAHQKMK